LAALRDSGLETATVVVVSGLSGAILKERLSELEQLIPGATLLVEPEGGLSRARNVALETVASTDVVAYIDDDAVIAATWRSAIEGAWSHASQDVAGIGGPVRPQFLAPRPKWLSDYLLAGLSILDYGPVATVLDEPGGLFLYGANLSLVAGHALAVGGFDVRRGPMGAGPGFGDDIDIQVRLRRAGYRVLYDPGAAVFHRIPEERLRRASMLQRRFAQGREQGRARVHRQISSAALGVGIGAIRAAWYTCRRHPADAMDHLSYSAQCAGTLRSVLGERTLGNASV
jgi:glycosyltransferase involved in cell wall biosynthesis